MNKTVAIITATQMELDPLLEVIRDMREAQMGPHTLYHGKLDDIDIIACCCGVGKVNAALTAQMLIDKKAPAALIMLGVAGGMIPGLHIGDVVVSEKLAHHDINCEFLSDYHPHMPKDAFIPVSEHMLSCARRASEKINMHFGVIVTGEVFIDQNGRQEIIDKFAPACVDMESAAAAHVCYLNKMPFIAVRGISDTEEDSGVSTFEENCDKSSRCALSVLRGMLEYCK